MATTHTVTSELTDDPTKFINIQDWIKAKIGEERATAMTSSAEDNQDGEFAEEFSYFYDAWVVDQKIIHVVQADNEVPRTTSYKDISPERIALCLTKLV